MDSNENNNENKEINKQYEVYHEEPKDVFAEGLPQWSIEPPQVVVRRKNRI